MANILIVEWIQLGAAAVGLMISLWALIMAQRDIIRNAELTGNMVDDAVGRIRRRRELLRVLKHSTLFLGGLVITTWRIEYNVFLQRIADVLGVPSYSTLLSYYTARYTMTAVSVLTTLETAWERYDRYIVNRLTAAEWYRLEVTQRRRRSDVAVPDPPIADRPGAGGKRHGLP